jgi:hypothetical protein
MKLKHCKVALTMVAVAGVLVASAGPAAGQSACGSGCDQNLCVPGIGDPRMMCHFTETGVCLNVLCRVSGDRNAPAAATRTFDTADGPVFVSSVGSDLYAAWRWCDGRVVLVVEEVAGQLRRLNHEEIPFRLASHLLLLPSRNVRLGQSDFVVPVGSGTHEMRQP